MISFLIGCNSSSGEATGMLVQMTEAYASQILTWAEHTKRQINQNPAIMGISYSPPGMNPVEFLEGLEDLNDRLSEGELIVGLRKDLIEKIHREAIQFPIAGQLIITSTHIQFTINYLRHSSRHSERILSNTISHEEFFNLILRNKLEG